MTTYGAQMDRKWTRSGLEVAGSGPEVDWKFIFLVNYNCDASYEHLWCPNGPEVNRKWTGSDRKWSGSGPEVDWKCPSVRPYISPSQIFPYLLDEPYARDLQAQGACALRFFLLMI